MIDIHNLIIHNVKKNQFDKTVTVIERPNEISVKKTQLTFFEKLLEAYYKRSNPAYGIFDKNTISYPYQNLVTDYLATKTTFKDFSIKALNHFVSKIKDETNATGGFFLVAHFTSQKVPFLAVIMVNNMTNYDIDETSLDIVEKATLDIEKVDVANILNLNKWKLNDTTYLTFTKGRKQISEYFINFIGCTLLTDSRHYSKNLKAAFNDFLVSEKYSEEQKVTYKMNAYSYLKEKSKSKLDINLTEFANSLFPENPETLYNHLTKEEYQINPTFKCDMGTFKDYQYIFYNGKDLNFRFHRSLINDQRITYDKENKTLTINKLDQSVINQIEQLEQDNQIG